MSRKKISIIVWGIGIFFLFSGRDAAAQIIAASTGEAVTQTVTLENFAIMEMLRDTWSCQCTGPDVWFAGYGFGGFSRARKKESGWEKEKEWEWEKEPDYKTFSPDKYRQRAGGFIIAKDCVWDGCCRRGFFFSYNNTRLGYSGIIAENDEKGLPIFENVETNNFLWGAYAKYLGPFGYYAGNMAAGYSHLHETRQFLTADPDKNHTPGHNENHEDQEYRLVRGHADTGAWRALVYGEIGTECCFHGLFLVQPFWGLQYYYSYYNQTRESLVFDRAADHGTLGRLRTNSFRSILGMRLRSPMPPAFRCEVTLDFIACWVHEFLDFGQIAEMSVRNFETEQRILGIYSGTDWAILSPVLRFHCGWGNLWFSHTVMFNAQETINMGLGGLEFSW